MLETILELWSFSFFRYALIGSALVALLCSLIGCFVVVRRESFIAGGIAHASYAGVGIAIFFEVSPFISILLTALLSGIIFGTLAGRKEISLDASTNLLWSGGMALGILLSDLTPGYQTELIGYLFGSLFSISLQELWLIALMTLLVFIGVVYFYHLLVAISYDEQFVKSRGLAVDLIRLLFFILLSVAISVAIRGVGLILSLALLSIAPMIASRHVRSIKAMILTSCCLNLCFMLIGIGISFYFDLSSGAAIILPALVFYLLEGIVCKYFLKIQK